MQDTGSKLCRVEDFFAKRSVLLTGGTGFIGMALIEGLLSSSPDLYRVYVLVREKRGFSPQERISRLLSSEIFNHLPSEVKAKVVLVMGEITAENLGLSPEILAEIRENVSVVYHNAGLIKFNRSLCEAVQMNVLTTLRCIDLAKSLKHFSAFIFSSTTLANTNVGGRILEEVYKTKKSPREMIKLALEIPSSLDRVAEIREDFIEGQINSYTYSKQLAENLILEEMSGYPVGIVRPALVFGFYDHHIPGWMGNSQGGHCNFVRGHVKGIARSGFGSENALLRSIPCDYLVRAMLCLTVSLGTQVHSSKLPEVVHLGNSRDINPIVGKEFCKILNEETWKNPCDSYIFMPRLKMRGGWRLEVFFLWFKFIALVFYIPERIFKLSPKWMRATTVVQLQYKAVKYFEEMDMAEDDLVFENATKLLKQLHPEDKDRYSFEIANVDWRRMFARSIQWTRKYYYKDTGCITWMHRVVQYIFLAMEFITYCTIMWAVRYIFIHLTGSVGLSTILGLAAMIFANWL